MKVGYRASGLLATCLLLLLASCVSVFKDRARGKFIAISEEAITIDFEEYRELILVEAEVNGKPGKFLLDNGFTLSAINPDFAKKAGVKFKRATSVTDGTNRKVKLQEATVKSVNIAGQRFDRTGFYLINTRNFFPCKEIDGVIGASIINKANWKIDFEAKTIQIGSVPFAGEGIKLPIRFSSNNNTSIDLQIEDQAFTAKVDLGKVDHLELRFRDFYPLFKGDTITSAVGIHSLSVSGLGEVDTGRTAVQSYRLYHGDDLIEETSPITLTNDLKYEAYLGIKWFKNYTLTINSTELEYVLAPIDQRPSTIDSSFGFAIYPLNEVYKIIKVNLDDPILPEQITLMKEVKEINGKDLNDFQNVCDFFSYHRDSLTGNQRLTLLLEGHDAPVEVVKHRPTRTVLH